MNDLSSLVWLFSDATRQSELVQVNLRLIAGLVWFLSKDNLKYPALLWASFSLRLPLYCLSVAQKRSPCWAGLPANPLGLAPFGLPAGKYQKSICQRHYSLRRTSSSASRWTLALTPCSPSRAQRWVRSITLPSFQTQCLKTCVTTQVPSF